MKQTFLLLACAYLAAVTLYAQHVGINTRSPAEKLPLHNGDFLITRPTFAGDEQALIGANTRGTKLLWISNLVALRDRRLLDNGKALPMEGNSTFVRPVPRLSHLIKLKIKHSSWALFIRPQLHYRRTTPGDC